MKEKSFRFRESFGKAVKAMNDKQAGKLLKGLCDYVFEGKSLESNDVTLASAFTLVKSTLDGEQRDRENGRRGGKVSAEMRKRESGIMVVSALGGKGGKTDEIINLVVSRTENRDEKGEPDNGEVLQKTDKVQAG